MLFRSLGSSLQAKGLILTIDVTGGCDSVPCNTYASTPGLVQVNTMDTFNIGSVSDFNNCVSDDLGPLGARWAPGFEPGNCGQQVFAGALQAAVTAKVSCIATWEVHECNVGPQPTWLFDAVNGFLAGKA